jgi:hypothetical protein
MRKKLYLETSVWNQLEQSERPDFEETALKFFAVARTGVFDLYISEVVLWEIDECRDPVRKEFLLNTIERFKPSLFVFDDEAQELRNKYVAAGVMSDTRRNRYYDTAHVAIASVNEVRFLLTFNFVHLLKIAKIEAFNGVNLLNGYGEVQLVSPEIFIPAEEE